MAKRYLTVLVTFFLSSCTNNMQTVKDSDNMITIPVDVERNPVVSISEFVEKIEIIPLETDAGCLIGVCDKFFFEKDLNIYFILDKKNVLHLFSGDGKFVSNSKSVTGQGPGEYMIITDATYNPHSKAVELLEPYGTVCRYDTSFNFIEKISLKQNKLIFHDFKPLSSNNYVQRHDSYTLMLYFCDYEQKRIDVSNVNADDNCPAFSFNHKDMFFFDNRQLCMQSGYYYYRIDTDAKTLERYIKLDFGKNGIKKQTLDRMFGKTQAKTSQQSERSDWELSNKIAEYLISSNYPCHSPVYVITGMCIRGYCGI